MIPTKAVLEELVYKAALGAKVTTGPYHTYNLSYTSIDVNRS